MKNYVQLFVVGVIVLMYSAVFADGECDKFKSPYDVTYCYCKLFIESDKELNTVYKELKDGLKEEMKKKLTDIQREWMKYRDNACQDKPGTIDVDCNYKVNKERTEYLRDRSRECKTGNCRDDMISKKSW